MSSRYWLIFPLFIALISVLPFLIAYPHTIGLDWSYFNALSLLFRSEILHYHVFPLHDPWMSGGTDLLSNSQSRLLSPLLLFEVIFDPVLANIFTLFFYALLGSFGCLQLARFLKWHWSSLVLLSTGFIWSSWFALHYSEGHIPFAAFQVLPLLQYFMLTQQTNLRSRTGIGLLFTLFLAEGQIYPFFFLSFYAVWWILLSQSFHAWRQRPREWILPALSLSLLFFARSYSTLANTIQRPLLNEPYSFSLADVKNIFYNPNQSLLYTLSESSVWRFHEFGCYVGVFWSLLFCSALWVLLKGKKIREQLFIPFLTLAFLWLWIASGWGGSFNPWTLFQSIPVLSRLHIQSRTLILFLFPFLMVSVLGWEKLREKIPFRWQLFLVIILACESGLVHSGTLIETLKAQGEAGPGSNLIASETLERTIPYAKKFEHYLELPNTGSAATYEPSAPATLVRSNDLGDYRGEIYTDSGDRGVKFLKYTPGKIVLQYDLPKPEMITMNTNFLMGWKTDSIDAGTVGRSDHGLLQWNPKESKGTIELDYHPHHLWLTAISAILGWLLLLFNPQRTWFNFKNVAS